MRSMSHYHPLECNMNVRHTCGRLAMFFAARRPPETRQPCPAHPRCTHSQLFPSDERQLPSETGQAYIVLQLKPSVP